MASKRQQKKRQRAADRQQEAGKQEPKNTALADGLKAVEDELNEDDKKLMAELEREQAELEKKRAQEEAAAEKAQKALDKKRAEEAAKDPKRSHVKVTKKKAAAKQKKENEEKLDAVKRQTKKAAANKVARKPLAKKETEKSEPKTKAKPVPKKKAAPAAKTAKPTDVLKEIPSENEIIYYDPNYLETEDGWNPRFDFGNMDEMVHSVGTRGVRQPIVCKPRTVAKTGEPLKHPRYVISSGHRRWMAAVKALDKGYTACKKVPIIVRRYKSESEAYADSIMLNDHKALNPLEICAALKHLQDDGKNIKEIAELIGKRQTWVRARLALGDAGQRLSTALMKGEISVRESVDIIKESKGDEEMQDRLVSKRNFAKKKKKMGRRSVDDDERKMTPARMRTLLNELATAYSRFRRGRGPAKDHNEDWCDLDDLLVKVRKAKSQGMLNI